MAIVGVSFDAPEDNQAWAEEQDYAFELWTDDERALALAYGAADSASQAFADRVTVILDERGALVLVYESVGVGIHPRYVLEDCQILFGG